MTNSWMNEDGEPIMDGAAWRFEQALDADYQPDPYDDGYYDAAGDTDPDDCIATGEHGDDASKRDGTWVCDRCGEDCDDPTWDADPMEDQWLDGSYEE